MAPASAQAKSIPAMLTDVAIRVCAIVAIYGGCRPAGMSLLPRVHAPKARGPPASRRRRTLNSSVSVRFGVKAQSYGYQRRCRMAAVGQSRPNDGNYNLRLAVGASSFNATLNPASPFEPENWNDRAEYDQC